MMAELPPLIAAQRLAAELKLPSWMGTVLYETRPSGSVLVVAADLRWRKFHKLPKTFHGYKVIGDEPLDAVAH